MNRALSVASFALVLIVAGAPVAAQPGPGARPADKPAQAAPKPAAPKPAAPKPAPPKPAAGPADPAGASGDAAANPNPAPANPANPAGAPAANPAPADPTATDAPTPETASSEAAGTAEISASVTAPVDAVTDTADLAAPDEAPIRRALVKDDVSPEITVFEGDDVKLRMGGLVQVHFAPLVGDDSLVANDDSANREGFRVRRARFGIDALFSHNLRMLLVVNPLQSDPEVGTLSDARLTYLHAPWLQVSVGTDKVPFSRAGLESSRRLASIERPLSVGTITPDRRLGATAEGALLEGRFAYLIAIMNGTEGYELGNQFGGFLYAWRVQYAAWGLPSSRAPERDGVSFGSGALLERGPATTTLAVSADVMLAISRAAVRLEALCDTTSPNDDPVISPDVSDSVDRCGAYAEVSYTLIPWSLQPVARVEMFDDDRAIDDAGDVIAVSVGANARLSEYARLQLHYLGRYERKSMERSNDALILNLQGTF